MGGTKKLYGAEGRGDVLFFDFETLKIITDPKHPQYDPRVERPADEAMVLSIMRLGIIEPLVIARDGDDVYVVDGRQRRINGIEANRRLTAAGGDKVLAPCVWRRGDDAKLFEVMIAANEVRSGESPMERAKKMQRLADMGRDEGQIAVVFGCDKRTVKAALALLECAPTVQQAVEAGLPIVHATKLSKLPRDEQAKKLDEMKAAGATRGKAATKALAGEVQTESPQRMRPRKIVEALRRELADQPEIVRVLDFVLGWDMSPDNGALRAASLRALGSSS